MSTETKLPDAEALAENIAAETAQATLSARANAAVFAAVLDKLEPQSEPFEVPAERQYFRLGKVCEIIQAAPPVVREICKRAGVKFVASVDDVPFIDGDGLREVLRYLDRVRRQYEPNE
jgi:hypothetical protein